MSAAESADSGSEVSQRFLIRRASAPPDFVPPGFVGRCKLFPKPSASGRDPLLLPYQSEWVLDRSRLKIAEKSRQIGWSWSEGYCIVRDKSQQGARLDHWVSSRDEIQARLFLEDCKGFAGLLHVAAQDLGEKVVDEDGHSAFVIEFANGLRCHSMSSNPDAQAGKRGGRTLDEFALHKDPRKLYSIAYPGITWGGAMSIFSTHRGTANFFNRLVLEARHKGNPKGFSLHRVTLADALEQGFLYKLQKKLPIDDERQQMDEAEYFDFIRAGAPDEESFLEEYMCVPSDDATAFLSYQLIDSCVYPPGVEWEIPVPDHYTALKRTPYEHGHLYLGVDVGRDHDLTVLWLMEKVGDVFSTRAVVEMQATPFDQQESVLYAFLRLPQVRRCCIDNTGLGRQFAERAQQRFGAYRVEGVNFSGPVKEELAYPVRSAFEDRTIRIPDDPKIRADFRAIKKETTAAGNIRFTADKGKNGHADRFWACALGLHAGKSCGDAGRFHPFTRSRRGRAMAARKNRGLPG